MKRAFCKLAIMLFACAAVFSGSASAQLTVPSKRAAHVQIKEGPSLEKAWNNWAIITWTSNNPGGTDEHAGVVRYGTDPKNLNRMAISPIRLNKNHPETVFRVRVTGLNPSTTYYYTVDSLEETGKSDGVKSPVGHFTTLQ